MKNDLRKLAEKTIHLIAALINEYHAKGEQLSGKIKYQYHIKLDELLYTKEILDTEYLRLLSVNDGKLNEVKENFDHSLQILKKQLRELSRY